MNKGKWGEGLEWMEEYDWIVFECKSPPGIRQHRHVVSTPRDGVFHHLIFVKDKDGRESVKSNQKMSMN